MIKIENVEVSGWEAAIRGMRNPMNSWEKSDSGICQNGTEFGYCYLDHRKHCPRRNTDNPAFCIGPKDLDLMTRLRNAGTDHRKFMRMITVYLDITAPLYWWKEFDTYKVGTVVNSCSTMHKIADKEFVIEDFSYEHVMDSVQMRHEFFKDSDIHMNEIHKVSPWEVFKHSIAMLNFFRNAYLEAKTKPMKEEAKRAVLMKKYWWQMIQLLPSSYNQRRTVMLNYEVLANIYKSRCNHKLDEWHDFCSLIEGLDYSELITGVLDGTDNN